MHGYFKTYKMEDFRIRNVIRATGMPFSRVIFIIICFLILVESLFPMYFDLLYRVTHND